MANTPQYSMGGAPGVVPGAPVPRPIATGTNVQTLVGRWEEFFRNLGASMGGAPGVVPGAPVPSSPPPVISLPQPSMGGAPGVISGPPVVSTPSSPTEAPITAVPQPSTGMPTTSPPQPSMGGAPGVVPGAPVVSILPSSIHEASGTVPGAVPDAGVQARASRWGEFFRNPATVAMMLQVGSKLMQPIAPGQSAAGHVWQALSAGAGVPGRFMAEELKRRQGEQQMQLAERTAQVAERGAAAQERGLGIAEQRETREGRQFLESMELERQQLRSMDSFRQGQLANTAALQKFQATMFDRQMGLSEREFDAKRQDAVNTFGLQQLDQSLREREVTVRENESEFAQKVGTTAEQRAQEAHVAKLDNDKTQIGLAVAANDIQRELLDLRRKEQQETTMLAKRQLWQQYALKKEELAQEMTLFVRQQTNIKDVAQLTLVGKMLGDESETAAMMGRPYDLATRANELIESTSYLFNPEARAKSATPPAASDPLGIR